MLDDLFRKYSREEEKKAEILTVGEGRLNNTAAVAGIAFEVFYSAPVLVSAFKE